MTKRILSGVCLAILVGPLLGCSTGRSWVQVLDVNTNEQIYTHAPARPASFAFNDEECLFVIKPVSTGPFAPKNPNPHRFDAIEITGGFAQASPPGARVRAYIGDRSETFTLKTAGIIKENDGTYTVDINAENKKRRIMAHIEGIPGSNPEMLRGTVGTY